MDVRRGGGAEEHRALIYLEYTLNCWQLVWSRECLMAAGVVP